MVLLTFLSIVNFTNLVWVVVLGSSSLLFALYFFQDKLVYMPGMPPGSRHDFLDPADFGFDREEMIENAHMVADDGVKIHGWFLKQDNARETSTMLYFHGNAGNISHRLANLKQLYFKLRCNIFILSYRGYGRSEGSPTEGGLVLDAQAALDWLRQHPMVDTEKVFVFGRSLGGAVGVQVTNNNPGKVHALVLENTFTNIGAMVEALFPPLGRFKFLATNTWDSLRVIPTISCPILFLSGGLDEIVPKEMMDALHEGAVGCAVKKFHRFEHAHHNDTWISRGYLGVLMTFLRDVKMLAQASD